MQRHAYNKLIEWKKKEKRKPLVIRGARQVGKTWLMKAFGKAEYEQVLYINCERTPSLHELFSQGVKVEDILLGFQVITGIKPTPDKTLIIIDEIQAVPQALTSLKYFYEDAPEYHVMTAGSLLGVALHAETSFPTGKVEFLNLYPLSFGEFLNALNQHPLNDLLKSSNWSMIKRFSEVLSTHLRWYYLVGGMPEVVEEFALNRDFKRVKQIQSDILNAYEQDFSKHAPIREVPRIRMVWNSIPSQLAKDNKKFIYGQLRSGARAKDYELAIQWLIDSGLAHRVTHVVKANVPLKAYEEAAYFKLYMLDVGLLSALSNLNAQTVIEKHRLFTEFKGALTEQFVMQELLHKNNNIHYWTSKASAELDFLIEYQNQIIPIEVKAEENLQSKSLKVFRDKYNPDTCFRFSMSHYRNESWLINIPLYAVGEFLSQSIK